MKTKYYEFILFLKNICWFLLELIKQFYTIKELFLIVKNNNTIKNGDLIKSYDFAPYQNLYFPEYFLYNTSYKNIRFFIENVSYIGSTDILFVIDNNVFKHNNHIKVLFKNKIWFVKPILFVRINKS